MCEMKQEITPRWEVQPVLKEGRIFNKMSKTGKLGYLEESKRGNPRLYLSVKDRVVLWGCLFVLLVFPKSSSLKENVT